MEQLPNHAGAGAAGNGGGGGGNGNTAGGGGAGNMPQQGQQQQHFQQNAQSIPFGPGMQVPAGSRAAGFYMQNPSQMPPGAFFQGQSPAGAFNPQMAMRLQQAQTHAGAQHGYGVQTAGPTNTPNPVLANAGMPGMATEGAAGMMMNPALGMFCSSYIHRLMAFTFSE